MKYVRVRNLEKYQHYTNRNPPWVKLHAAVLTDYEFGRLPDAAKWHACAITLLASRMGNSIPADPAWIAARTQSNSKPDLKLLIECGYLEQDASKMLQLGYQNGVTETEGETETEREADQDQATSNSQAAESVKAKNGEPPPEWVELAALLKRSPRLNVSKLLDWTWWDKQAAIYDRSENTVDFCKEVSKMDAWLYQNPRDANKKDWRRFVSGWLSRCDERGGS